MRIAPGVALILLLPAIHPTILPAQHLRTVPPEPSCPACTIVFERLAEFGEAEGDGWVDLTPRFAVQRDRVVLVNLQGRDRLRVFSRSGAFERIVGRRGGGPGEYGLIMDVVASPDGRLHVVDREHRRITVLDEELKVERVVPLPGLPVGVGLLPLEDGGYVANLLVPTSESLGRPLHRLASDGTALLSYDVRSEEVRLERTLDQLRRLASSRDGTFWSAVSSGYVIERHTMDGPLQGSWVLPPPWEEVEESRIRAGFPQPLLMTLQEDPEGLLWVVSRRADPGWEEAMSSSFGAHGWTPQIDVFEGYFDSVVDVLDPESGRLVVRFDWPGYLLRFVAPWMVLAYEDAEVEPKLVLYRVRLEGR